jgi:hypothetical protein
MLRIVRTPRSPSRRGRARRGRAHVRRAQNHTGFQFHLFNTPFLRLRLDWFLGEIDKSGGFCVSGLCAGHVSAVQWIALGEQLMVGFENVGKAQRVREISPVTRNLPTYF